MTHECDGRSTDRRTDILTANAALVARPMKLRPVNKRSNDDDHDEGDIGVGLCTFLLRHKIVLVQTE